MASTQFCNSSRTKYSGYYKCALITGQSYLKIDLKQIIPFFLHAYLLFSPPSGRKGIGDATDFLVTLLHHYGKLLHPLCLLLPLAALSLASAAIKRKKRPDNRTSSLWWRMTIPLKQCPVTEEIWFRLLTWTGLPTKVSVLTTATLSTLFQDLHAPASSR